MEYWKLNSLWKREGWYFEAVKNEKSHHEVQKHRQSFIIGDYATPEFKCIKEWRVTEKVDGTNIRIEYKKGDPQGDQPPIFTIKGRSDNAQIPPHLLEHLQSKFTLEKMIELFPDADIVRLFGEGFGPKIQSVGGLYASSPSFALFDVVVGGWVLNFDDVMGIAAKFEVPHVPDLGIMSTEQVEEFVKSLPPSRISKCPVMMEGVVCTTHPVMMFRKGGPIKMKLKCCEYTRECA